MYLNINIYVEKKTISFFFTNYLLYIARFMIFGFSLCQRNNELLNRFFNQII